MSKHNIYPQFSKRVVERWQKACIHAVAGKRINPYKSDEQLDFVLRSSEDDYDFSSRKLRFNYANDVIELYSADEVELFAALNENAIRAGMLVPYTEAKQAVNLANALSDEQIDVIISISNHLKFQSEIGKITSPLTLKRIQEKLPDTRSVRFFRIIEDRLKEL